MIPLSAIARFLDRFFDSQRFAGDQNGVYRPSQRPVTRLGLALEAWPGMATWLQHNQIDAVLLHRPWSVEPERLGDIGVLGYHLAFDECMTLGFNPRLAAILELTSVEACGDKDGRPLGMLGNAPAQSFQDLVMAVDEMFGGHVAAQPGQTATKARIAVVGAMTDALVREASRRGADVYLTGQLRQPAAQAVAETGIGVVAIGHHRSELWGLRALAGVLRERWSNLSVIVASDE